MGHREYGFDASLCSLLEQDVAAHAFVGADAVHITGAIQEQVMPIVGYKASRLILSIWVFNLNPQTRYWLFRELPF